MRYEVFVYGSVYVEAEDESEAEEKAVEVLEGNPKGYMEVKELEEEDLEEEEESK